MFDFETFRVILNLSSVKKIKPFSWIKNNPKRLKIKHV